MLNTIINIIVLLLSLSVLICLHELGHLLVAKKFNVYCAEYSIGMGPLLFKVKKPNQETQFSIRAIPIGGFVSMAGEGSEEIDEMKDVPKERFLTSIKRWKRALIMVAGVFVNFVLSLILFFGSGLASPILDESKQSFKVMDSTSKVTYLASEAGLTSNDVITNFKYVFNIGSSEKVSSKEIASGRDLYKAYYMSGLDEKEYAPTSTNDKLTVYLTTIDSRTISFTISAVEQTVKNAFGPDVVYYAWNLNEAGLDFNTRHRNFKEAMNRASDEFVTSLTSFKVLFQPGGWKNLGGVISVYQVSSYATGVGFYYYLYVWGYISLNLAIVNLLPFPGLDGWHLVVCAFEGITRKDMPTKVREVMSVIGTVLLIGLMIFVTVLDILRL
ncbi:MAG: M50 family metallopeptidase [Bacilli bacterium]|nr:M50 family metallopeptidase [Bacillales bacterium]MDY2575693.1 M50 family metallopeptidase [Bacilli bacterium]